ncbi:MAG: aldehyde dehydrogenase [Phycisphaeraceae bacterium]|nr:aldehyde dehydrogenase [Phycisphaeraceae bacterium]MCW5755090.1 aldehyde dehydrogenase [Phycisphaeraceae bacterium]
MTHRVPVLKTYKLFIGGAFPRTESGRSTPIADGAGRVIAHASRASRKDLRAAVESARSALEKWGNASGMLRGQVLYRVAEMMEGRRAELAEAIAATGTVSPGDASDEVAWSIDRMVCFAGWADKFAQVLGCNNPVSGPYYNFTIPEATGVAAVVCPDVPSLLALTALAAPVLCAGNTVVVVPSEANPLPSIIFAECCATGDVPGGTVNVLTGPRDELVPWIAGHRDIDAVHASGVSESHAKLLREGAAENLKRVLVRQEQAGGWHDPRCTSPWWIEPFVEMKTVWHPSAT